MRIKLHGAMLAPGQSSLCHTCRHATVVKGPRLRDEIVECDALAYGRGRVMFPVTFCSAHVDRQHPTVREMEDIAWVLRTDPKRRQVGFVHAKALRPRDRYILPDD